LRYIKAILYSVLTAVLLLLTVTVVSSYNRSIQEFVVSQISSIYDINKTWGKRLYDVSDFVFNTSGFDQEARIKDTIYEKYKSVVLISTENTLFPQMSGIGTGFIFEVHDDHALIMTNHHVVDGKISLGETVNLRVSTPVNMWDYEAEIIGYDRVIDIAILKINKREDEEWQALEFADPKDINDGDPIVVIGHGLSLAWTSTYGHVSFSKRYAKPYNIMLQIDAVVNQGNSGGPVIGLDGKVYGIISSILSPGRRVAGWDGVGFAVHPEQAVRSIEWIMNEDAPTEYVPYADILFPMKHLSFEEVKDIPKEDRNLVVVDYSNADPNKEWAGQKAGLINGDVILRMDDKKIVSSYQVMVATVYALPGDEIVFDILRDGEPMSVTVIAEELDYDQLINMLRGLSR
jgi:serine protease Do